MLIVITKKSFKNWLRLMAAWAMLAGTAWGQLSEQTLKSFGFPSQSAAVPLGVLVGGDGALYGTTGSSVFRVNPDGTGFTLLHSFGSFQGDGYSAAAGLLLATDGMLYGTTSTGGTNGAGTVFKINPDGSGYAIIYNFGNLVDGFGNAIIDGNSPEGALIQGADGDLYGTTTYGGTNYIGTVFKLGTDGSGYTVLYSIGTDTNDSGAYPDSALVQGPDGTLYGTTLHGGTNVDQLGNNLGTAFKLGTNGLDFSELYQFGAGPGDGVYPFGLVLGTNGALYGTTEYGGISNSGTIFTLHTDGSGYSVLHNFLVQTVGDGQYPGFGLIRGLDDVLYGTTREGGAISDSGVVYRLDESGSGYEVIRRFAEQTSLFANYSTDGTWPEQLAQASDGTLYGVTQYGGAANDSQEGVGTIFTLATNGSDYSMVWDFSESGGDGVNPQAGLVLGLNGTFYGTTSSGGAAGAGAAFKLNSNGSGYEVLHSFGVDPTDGLTPEATLIQGSDGMLYGTTYSGGYVGSEGVVFKMNSDGSDYTLLYSFYFFGLLNDGDLGDQSGKNPMAPLLQLGNNELYGTTSSGGAGGAGTVFELGTDGSGFSILHAFETNGLDGQQPEAGLIQGNDGALYGTTCYGGTNLSYYYPYSGSGTVFKLNADGSNYKVLYEFGNSSGDGQYPTASLLEGLDGVLYGTTSYGGTNNNGTVFKLDPDGSGYAVLYNFGNTNGTDGIVPVAALVQDANGVLYGVTSYGGEYSYGTIFMINTNGSNYTVLYNFGGNPVDGQNPAGALIKGPDGAFYGTTKNGGDPRGDGTIFRFGTAPFQFTSFSRLADNNYSLSLVGSTNTTCRIDASTNLVDWVILTNFPDATGGIQFTDLSASHFPRRFYRAVQTP